MKPDTGPLIAPSILGADFLELGAALSACERAGADLVHCDVMDGRFVPANSYGAMICAAAAGGSRPGLAIKPGTPFAAMSELAPEFDLVLVMTVEPGAGGQTFMPECLPKVAAAAELRRETESTYLIEVDGGVSAATIADCACSGADVFVAGSAVFGHPSGPAGAIELLRSIASM